MSTKISNIKTFFTNKITLSVAAVFAAIAPWIIYAGRVGYVFIDNVLFFGFCMTLFWISVVNAIFVIALARIRLDDMKIKDKAVAECKIFIALSVIGVALTLLFTVIWIAFLAVMGGESAPVAGRALARTAPIVLLIYAALFFGVFFQKIPGSKVKIVAAAAVSLVGILGLISYFHPFTTFEFVSAPAVIDTGSEYSVVFATTDNSTGYIEYSYGDKEYKIYDESGGRKINSQIHSIKVPYDHLVGNSYRVGSTRIVEELSYGGRSGKTLLSDSYFFVAPSGESQRWLCVSDWHTHLKQAAAASENVGEYEGVILLGDAAPGLQCEEEAVEYIVRFAGNVSGGTKPIIYVRGNHETRGAYASKLLSALGLNEFYNDIVIGDYRFIVLDSGEDKKDDHPEYGGMNDYAAYRAKMTEWIENLAPSEDKKVIAISHSDDVCIEKELSERAIAALKKLNAAVMLSGHEHYLSFEGDKEIPTYIDGGWTKEGFVANLVELGPSGIKLTATDVRGKIIETHTIPFA